MVDILGLTRAVRGDRPPAGAVTGFDCFDCLGQGADLIELDQQGIGCLFLDRLTDSFCDW